MELTFVDLKTCNIAGLDFQTAENFEQYMEPFTNCVSPFLVVLDPSLLVSIRNIK